MQKEVNDYLAGLRAPMQPYRLSEADQNVLSGQGEVAFLMSKLMRRNFRRRVGDDTRLAIEKKIAVNVAEKRPIHFTVPFGGYKHFWNPSHPEPDWAEVLHLRFMIDYVQPLLAVHEPGVLIEYVSEDLMMPRMDNYPESALDAYSAVFRELIDWYQQLVPANLRFDYLRERERVDVSGLVAEVEARWQERRPGFDQLSDEDKARELNRSSRSIMWDGKRDLTHLTEQERHERIIESRLIELTFFDVDSQPEYMGDYLHEDNHICLAFSFGMSRDNDEWGDLTLHTAHGCGVDHWIGRGVIRETNNRLGGTIISRSQYEAAAGHFVTVDVAEPPIDRPNFHTVDVLPTLRAVQSPDLR